MVGTAFGSQSLAEATNAVIRALSAILRRGAIGVPRQLAQVATTKFIEPKAKRPTAEAMSLLVQS